MRGAVINRMEAGRSTIIAMTITAIQTLQLSLREAPEGAGPLVHHNRTWHGLRDHSRLGGEG